MTLLAPLGRLLATLTLVFGSASLLHAAEASPAEVDFNRDIRPILSDACFRCHGPDDAQRQSELRLDTKDGAYVEIEGRRALVPGKPEQSELVHRITTNIAGERMPPPEAPRQLAPREIDLLRRWIEQGAEWEQHWSFVPPVRSAPPSSRYNDRVQNAVDSFVFARLEREGLEPSPPADEETLLRRVTLDLTGLPPTPDEVDAFLAEGSPDAYDRAVERLLASPRLGERMAVMWLDAARYADTSGYQTDGERHMWRWRDWVIDAFNHNQSFEDFTIQQLAGDLLPDATLDTLIASGFNRNHRANSEGGIVFEEYLVEYAADRVDTTATVWLGLTIGCARCHDHKYDPITQREFYQLFAYFNRVPEMGRVFKFGNSPPLVKAPTPPMAEELARLDARLDAARAEFDSLRETQETSQRDWEQRLASSTVHKVALDDVQFYFDDALAAQFPLDGDATNTIADDSSGKFEGAPQFVPGRVGGAAQFDGSQFAAAELNFTLSDLAPFTLAAWVRPEEVSDATILALMNDADTRDGGLSLHFREGRLQLNMGPRWLDDALRIESERRFEPGEWLHVAVTYDSSRVAAGLTLYVNGRPEPFHVGVDLLTGGFTSPKTLRIGSRGPEGHFRGAIDDVRVYRSTLLTEEVAALACSEPLPAVAATPREKRTPTQAAKLRCAFLTHFAPQVVRRAHATLRTLTEDRRRFWEAIPSVMVMSDAAKRETFVLTRGEYDKPGEPVTAGTPASLPPLPSNAELNRLALARWVVDPTNPLTARVAVNRFWRLFFGEGLVASVEDFGAQGDWPSHPELLDWLAVEFVKSGWDMKALMRTIVTSAVYRQSSHISAEQQAKDPANRLLSRAPRLRLSAEMSRDQALAASGLLHGPLGGPSVKPYQPPGIWEEIASAKYMQDHGAALYRRSLYTFWKRTVPPPGMAAFDAPSRESCVVRRSRTNTPLQALTLMNETTFVEAARSLATRMMVEADANPSSRLEHGFRLILGRRPRAEEADVLLRNWRRNLARFAADADAAKALLSQGELPSPSLDPAHLAAYTLTASLMLNLDEAVTRE